MTEGELRQLIERVAEDFRRSSNYGVSEAARQALLQPAIPHLDDVTGELDRGNITVAFLEMSVRQILDNSLIDVRDRRLDLVDALAVERSLSRYCPYLFWC